jgi:hypothetical protein
MNIIKAHNANLPVRNNLMLILIYASSLVITVLMAVASITGLIFHSKIYPTEELLRTCVPNDVVNLFIGLPILIGSMWLAWRGSLLGLLFWPGALFYVFYNAIGYVFALSSNAVFLMQLIIAALSVYTLISLVVNIEGKAIQQQLTGAVPAKVAGGILAGLGFLFFVRVIAAIVSALTSHTPLTETELALHTSDLLITPAWVIGGILLWQHKELGYVTGLGLLFQASMLFIALIIFLLLQPILTKTRFALADIILILIMGLICFVPFALFVRSVLSKSKVTSSPAKPDSLW